MNKLWQQLAIATNWPVLAAVAVLSTLGVVSIWADKQAKSDGFKQLIFLGVAVLCLALFQGINYLTIGRYAWPFYFVSLALLLYTLVGQKVSLPGVHSVRAPTRGSTSARSASSLPN